MHHYFARNPSEWSIEGFLKNCEEQKTIRARIGVYIACLNKIVNDENEEIPRREKAQKLLNKYQTGDKADRKIAMNWELGRESQKIPSININNTISGGTFSGCAQTIGTIDSSIFSAKRYYEEEDNYEEEQEQTKRVRFDEEKSKEKLSLGKKGGYFADGTKIKKSAPLNLLPSDDDYSSEEHDSEDNEQDDDEDAPSSEETLNSVLSQKKWILPSGENVGDVIARNVSANAKAIQKKKKTSAIERATLRYGSSRIIDLSTNMKDWFSVDDRKFMIKNHNAMLQVPAMENEESSFVTTVENMICEEKANEAYKFCFKTHFNSEENSFMYKLSKIYCDFIYRCKDQTDMLDHGHTEIDVILKTCSYIIEGLNKGLVIRERWGESFCPLTRSIEYNKGRKCDVRFLSTLGADIGEWEFASNFTAQKAIGDRCRSARINQSILNGLLNRNLNDEQAKKINVPFLQVAGTSAQMLVEDLVEGFYVVFPGPTFEFPTKLQHIENLKSAVNIIKFVMDKYNQINKIVESKVRTHNAFDDIFSNNNDLSISKYVHCKSKYICEPWWTPK
ncbi:14977_t:CDS:2, partial [Funneliformis geosporum]